jgi:hypothetical protein
MTSTNPRVEFLPGKKTRAWLFYDLLIVLKDGTRLIVPKGAETDFASVPWIFRRLLPRVNSPYLRASILHDFAYRHGYVLNDKGARIHVTQRRADWLLRVVARLDGANWAQAWALWSGVRVGGWRAWSRHRKRERIAQVAMS